MTPIPAAAIVLELRGRPPLRNRPLDRLDLVVTAGELIAVSGEDSSDLLWTLAGSGGPEVGTVLVDGRAITDHEEALAAGVVLIPQGGGLASILTAYENVLLALLAPDTRPPVPGKWAQTTATRRRELSNAPTFPSDREVSPGSPAEAARRALAQVGLVESADHLVEELSGGQQQRVAIARAIAARPHVLLADQATTDLDPANRARMIGLLRDLLRGGSVALLASDDPAVLEACDRVVTL